MNPILKNFLRVIRRYQLAAILNVLGLSVAFAAFMVIMIQLNYDFGFDKFHKNSDKIFRVERVFTKGRGAYMNRPLSERFIESSPYIVAGTVINPNEFTSSFYMENDSTRNFYEEKSLTVTPGFFDVFTFDFVERSTDTYIAQGSIYIPLSMSRKIFGNEPAVGKQIVHSAWGNQTIIGVYRDIPANSTIKNYIYYAMQESENKDSWRGNNYHLYIRVNDASKVSMLYENFKNTFDGKTYYGGDFESDYRLVFTALPDIHFATDVQYDDAPKTSKQTLLILLTIAILIIAIAMINFTNFSMALTPMRVKSINTQRVLGARRNTLRWGLVFEAVTFSFLSYLVALLLVSLFNDSPLSKYVDAQLSFAAQPMIIGGTALFALLVGLLAGAYPSRYMTSFTPALVLNGSFGLSPKGKKLRNTLIGIQFVASFALIVGTSFMFLQNHFMQHSSLGYDKDELLTVNIKNIQGNRDVFTHQLKTYSGIEDVTYGQWLLSSSDNYNGYLRYYEDMDTAKNINITILPVHHTFLKVMGIDMMAGRDFRAEDANMQQGVFVFNETARNRYNLEIGAHVGCTPDHVFVSPQGEIVGFISDVKFASFRKSVYPMAFYVWGTENLGDNSSQAYIRVKAGADKLAAISYINATLAGFDAKSTFNVRFYDEILQRLYEKEISLNSLITLFSLIAIFISIVGVLGLVVFDSECRRKEIGIRKVFGASTMDIIFMFNKSYFKILAICFLIAAPLAWYAVTRWLENFAYKTPMYWWVYLLAFVVVGAITVATVTFQNWRVANDNPVNSIKKD